MKRLLAALFLSFAAPAFAQESVISMEKMNKLYIGIPNPVKVMVEGMDCGSLFLRVGAGEVKNTGDCSFDVWVPKPGEMYLEVGVQENGHFKPLGKRLFRMKYIPDPVVRLIGKMNGIMPINLLKSADSIYAQLDNFDFDVQFDITRFNIAISRNGKDIFDHEINGNRFDEITKRYFNSLAAGDKLMITDIHGAGPDKRDRHLNDIVLTLN